MDNRKFKRGQMIVFKVTGQAPLPTTQYFRGVVKAPYNRDSFVVVQPFFQTDEHGKSSPTALFVGGHWPVYFKDIIGLVEPAALNAPPPCDDCGERVENIVGCPDGAEVCHECFDQGRH